MAEILHSKLAKPVASKAMKKLVSIGLIILGLSACKTQSSALETDFDVQLDMSETIQIEAQLWRNMMPMVGNEADRSLQINVIFRLPQFIERDRLQLDSAVVLKGDESWSASFDGERWEEKRRQLHYSAGGGPEWRIDESTEVKIFFRMGEESHQRTLPDSKIMGTY